MERPLCRHDEKQKLREFKMDFKIEAPFSRQGSKMGEKKGQVQRKHNSMGAGR